MRDHRGRRSILDFGIGDDTDTQAEPPLRKAGDVFDPGVVEWARGAVGVDAHRVNGRLVAGGVGAGRVGRIGDDGIRAGGRHQRHVRHVVDGQLAETLAFRNALGKQPRRDAMRRRQAVADEQDHVLRLARPGVVDRPHQLAAARAIADFDRNTSGLRQRDVAKHQRRLVLAVFALNEGRGPAEHGGIILAVDRHPQLRRIDPVRKFDLEVELRAGKDLRAVDRVDRLGKNRRSRHQDDEKRRGEMLDHDGAPRQGHARGWRRPLPGKHASGRT